VVSGVNDTADQLWAVSVTPLTDLLGTARLGPVRVRTLNAGFGSQDTYFDKKLTFPVYLLNFLFTNKFHRPFWGKNFLNTCILFILGRIRVRMSNTVQNSTKLMRNIHMLYCTYTIQWIMPLCVSKKLFCCWQLSLWIERWLHTARKDLRDFFISNSVDAAYSIFALCIRWYLMITHK
jgi:hypothetical protein